MFTLVSNGIKWLTRFKVARPADIVFEMVLMCGRQFKSIKSSQFVFKGLVKKYRGWAGAFGNVVDKKYMTHPLPPSQKGLTHPLVKTRMFGFL